MICILHINNQLISSGLWRIMALASSLSVRNFGVTVELDLTSYKGFQEHYFSFNITEIKSD